MKHPLSGASLGREIRRRREAREMTLEDLAERSGLTTNYVGSVELGHRDPSLSTILALAKGFGIRPGTFFPSATGLDPTTDEAARLFEQVSPAAQAGILALLKAVMKRPRNEATCGGDMSPGALERASQTWVSCVQVAHNQMWCGR